ncbi:heme ABC transporter ATP-binding protein [Salipiger sp. IMCC34102]|uniref:heme ABC transporter ATP-binding protein n=1 Tax=Salipiger sp. IMCC34102 TaxID=2510647 RepID=UPI00101B8F77|nr:heme ABC transporter ATP-binding protein [Salipiger sp. IMCC34102]RYH04468.1 heme ABC transporter ATP-binding protein [Salipiger sp. IMCC34102]
MSVIGKDIRATLGTREVLRGIDVEARAGEVTAIIGPNGSGKTTLLRCLTGELACHGTVTLDGEDIHAMPAHALAARRAVLEQATPLAFPFTVAEVVRLGHRAGAEATDPGVPRAALAAVGLQAKAGRFFQELSGGERQRVQLARVLAQVWSPVLDRRSRWLFLDEPVASLDIAHQLEVMHVSRGFADAGGGVVTVMHDLNLTAMGADRVILVSEGRILKSGAPDAVLTDTTLSAAYACGIRVNTAPVMPFILPQAARPVG